MNNREWISLYHGMELEPIADDSKRFNENGVLFLCQLLLIKSVVEGITEEEKEITNNIILNLRTHQGPDRLMGLFDRGKDESKDIPKDKLRTISNDNITAIVSISNLLGFSYSRAIAKHGIKNKMIYDNVFPESPRLLYKTNTGQYKSRLQHPRDWHYWLYNGKIKVLGTIFYPIFAISNIITCCTPKEETSGKLLMFTRLFNRKEWHYKILWNICSKILIKKYGKNWLSAITAIYYHQREDNPIRVLAAELEKKNLL